MPLYLIPHACHIIEVIEMPNVKEARNIAFLPYIKHFLKSFQEAREKIRKNALKMY